MYHPKQDPLVLSKQLWPNLQMYQKQREVLASVWDNDETYVPAGNMLGKDWIAGMIVLLFFLQHHPVRIVTTSVADRHLIVLWSAINEFISLASVPLLQADGGPLVVNHRQIKKVYKGEICPISYVVGMVAESPEKMAGHHAPNTLFVADECSGLWDQYYTKAQGWAGGGGHVLPDGRATRKRMLFIGNPYHCSNFWRRNIEAGDLLAPG